jgi:hypothetical protein
LSRFALRIRLQVCCHLYLFGEPASLSLSRSLSRVATRPGIKLELTSARSLLLLLTRESSKLLLLAPFRVCLLALCRSNIGPWIVFTNSFAMFHSTTRGGGGRTNFFVCGPIGRATEGRPRLVSPAPVCIAAGQREVALRALVKTGSDGVPHKSALAIRRSEH